MHTEEQARTKWRPETLGMPETNQADASHWQCRASECMAWRWGADRRSPECIDTSDADACPDGEGWEVSTEYLKAVERGTKPNHFTRWVRRRLTPTGYCEKAGKP